ncbi:MAG: GspMb/PilO family protein [Dehalococcoidales bacterium]
MKLRKPLTVVLMLVLLAVYYILGTDYRKQRHENAALAAQVSGATEQLAQIPAPPADLEQRQAAADAGLEAEINVFPANLNSTRIVNDILKLAEATGVKAIPVITQPWTVVSVNETDYPVFRLNIDVKGTYAQVAGFISLLENGEPATLVIEDLTMERVDGPSLNGSETGDTVPVDTILNIAIYARPTVKVNEK